LIFLKFIQSLNISNSGSVIGTGLYALQKGNYLNDFELKYILTYLNDLVKLKVDSNK
jgi:hypothetical protein